MVFNRWFQKPAASDWQLVNLPVFPSYVLGWHIRQETTQPGKLVWVVDNRVAPGGYGSQAVGFYLDVILNNDTTYGLPLYPLDPFGPSVEVPAGELAIFELESYLPGAKLDQTHGTWFGMSIESRGAAAKTKVGVLCGAPVSELYWFGIVVDP